MELTDLLRWILTVLSYLWCVYLLRNDYPIFGALMFGLIGCGIIMVPINLILAFF